MTSFTAIREWSGNDGLVRIFCIYFTDGLTSCQYGLFLDFTTECLNFKIPGNKKGLLMLHDRYSSYETFESWMIQQVNNTELNIIVNCIGFCLLVETHSFV